MQFGDVAFRERHHAHAGEGQPLVDAGDFFLVARDTVERFGEHDIEALPLRIFHQGLDAGTDQARSGDRAVAIAVGDAPALALGPLAAKPELVFYGGVTLKFGGITGVEGDGEHGGAFRNGSSLRVWIAFCSPTRVLVMLSRKLPRERPDDAPEPCVRRVGGVRAVLIARRFAVLGGPLAHGRKGVRERHRHQASSHQDRPTDRSRTWRIMAASSPTCRALAMTSPNRSVPSTPLGNLRTPSRHAPRHSAALQFFRALDPDFSPKNSVESDYLLQTNSYRNFREATKIQGVFPFRAVFRPAAGGFARFRRAIARRPVSPSSFPCFATHR